MIWPFRRRQPVHVGPTSVDWKPGDMAECVEALDPDAPRRPSVGDRLLVTDVFYGVAKGGRYKLFGLTFAGYAGLGFDSVSFRKIILTDTGADRTVGKRAPVRAKVTA